MRKTTDSFDDVPSGIQSVETQLDENTIRELDLWRSTMTPQPSRAEAARLLLEERLCTGEFAKTVKRQPHRVCPDLQDLAAIYALEQVSGFGPVKFRTMYESGIDAQDAIENPEVIPFEGRIGEKLRRGIKALSKPDLDAASARAKVQLERAFELSASILVHGDSDYPEQVYVSNNPVPVIYVRGDTGIWRDAGTVAVVGSRKTRLPYADSARMFAAVAAKLGMVVVSGFADGADRIGHESAFENGGRTICVMPCGLDLVFPPENRDLWEQLLAYPQATFVSEFGFGLRASSLLLRKRNKLIVAFSRGILVAQSALDGGAMNAYRFGREQRKPVATFRSDGTRETSGNALIAEDSRTNACVFGLTCNESSYEPWLERLSC